MWLFVRLVRGSLTTNSGLTDIQGSQEHYPPVLRIGEQMNPDGEDPDRFMLIAGTIKNPYSLI